MRQSDDYLRLDAGETALSPDVEGARAEFAASRSLVCRDAIAPDLFAGLVRRLARSGFTSNAVEHLGHREIETPEVVGTAITLVLRRAPLFRWLESVTGCAAIASVVGRVVQTRPRPGDELVWHDDSSHDEARRLGVTIALDSPPYEGGEFEMRRVGERALLRRFRHDRPGTALVFEVSPALEHRVLPLVAGGPRRVYTGWFVG